MRCRSQRLRHQRAVADQAGASDGCKEQKCGVVTGVDDNESGDGRAQAAIWGCKPIFAGSLRISTRPRRFPRR
ncbi:hypothetical protein DXU07_11905 [Bradyrhizobium elkanii]